MDILNKNKNSAIKQVRMAIIDMQDSVDSLIEYVRDHEERIGELEEVKKELSKTMIEINAKLGVSQTIVNQNNDTNIAEAGDHMTINQEIKK